MDPKKQFYEFIEKSIEKDDFIKVTLGKYRGREADLERILIALIKLKGVFHFSFTYRFKRKDMVKNFSIEEGTQIIKEVLGRDFLSANLYTASYDHFLFCNRRRQFKLTSKASGNKNVPSRNHDREKNRPIEANNDWLQQLGITTNHGKVKSDKQAKFRQINRFIEIVDATFKQSDAYLRDQVKIVDMGSGKSYLTFALYDYFNNKMKMQTKVVGVEQREELVEFSNELAGQTGFKKLFFEQGAIADANVQGADVMVALHACDTATDDALLQAIENRVEVILVAPCCQHYVRKKMTEPDELKPITKNGIIKENLSVILTDSLRALTLEAFGYKTKVFEFIDMEHTSKNLMISAVLNKKAEFNFNKLKEINQIMHQFGIPDFYLDTLVFQSDEDEDEEE